MMLRKLIEHLHHPDRNVRSQAVLRIGELGDISALDSLLQTVGNEPDFYVREDITWALVRMGDASVMPLIDLLRNENPNVRHHAAHTLSKIGDVRVLNALMEALYDPEPAVTTKIAFSLGQLGDPRAIPALLGLVGHEHREVQTTVSQVLEQFGTAALHPLIDLLHHERWQIREQAADILGLIGDQAAVSAITEGLSDKHWQVRFAAVTALGHIGGGGVREALRQMPEDTDNRVRSLVVKVKKQLKVRE